MENKITRYENWKELKPLTEPVSIDTKCVCLVDDFCFKAGDVVTVVNPIKMGNGYWCESVAGELTMFWNELALLPITG